MSAAAKNQSADYDVDRIRADFPGLHQQVHDHPLVYFDNAATLQKPQSVLTAIMHSYTHDCANVHRGLHTLSARATDAFEAVRGRVRNFVGAAADEEIIFTSGATASINIVARAWGDAHLVSGDEIVITAMEHHANIVPWQMLCERSGAVLKVVPLDESGALDMAAFEQTLSSRTRLVAAVHVSNALGTVNPVAKMAEMAHRHDALMLVDGAQSVIHQPIDVQQLGCDFFVFSGHKIGGPTGIGVLYGKLELLESLPPLFGGGDMIDEVTFEKTTYNDLPHRLEAGTPHIAGVIGLGAAVVYLNHIGMANVHAYEQDLFVYANERMAAVTGVRILSKDATRAGVIAFTMEGAHPNDIGTLVDMEGVAIRTGHHCAQPVLNYFDITASARASLALYNTRPEVDRLVEALEHVREMVKA